MFVHLVRLQHGVIIASGKWIYHTCSISYDFFRIWFDRTGRYLGYLGQGRPVVIPSSIPTNTHSSTYLPCDITERPLEATKPVKQDKGGSQDKDVPLVLSSDRLVCRNKSCNVSRTILCATLYLHVSGWSYPNIIIRQTTLSILHKEKSPQH